MGSNRRILVPLEVISYECAVELKEAFDSVETVPIKTEYCYLNGKIVPTDWSAANSAPPDAVVVSAPTFKEMFDWVSTYFGSFRCRKRLGQYVFEAISRDFRIYVTKTGGVTLSDGIGDMIAKLVVKDPNHQLFKVRDGCRKIRNLYDEY